jgi:HEPN domain-containing protein
LSSHHSGVEALRRRAQSFLAEARAALNSGRYDIACFLAEQAAQLHLKATLLQAVGDYPRTHHIRTLLGELLKSRPSERLERFARSNRAGLSSLEDAYIMARYSTKEFYREDAEEGVKLAEELVTLLEEVAGDG